MLGGLLSCTGLILSSFASSLEYLYISMGVLTGTYMCTLLMNLNMQPDKNCETLSRLYI